MLKLHMGSYSTAIAAACVLSARLLVTSVKSLLAWVFVYISAYVLVGRKGKKLPPGSLGFLGIHDALCLIWSLRHAGGPVKFISDRTAKSGSETFKTSLFLHPTVVVQGAAANGFLASNESKLNLVNSWPDAILELLGRNVPLAVHGTRHRRQRQILSSCLGTVALDKVVGIADRLTQKYFDMVWRDGAQISVVDTTKMHVFRIACILLAGTEDESLLNRMQAQFRIWVEGIADVPIDFPGTAYNKAKRARDALWHEIDLLIQRKEEQLQLQMAADSTSSSSHHDEDLISKFILARDEDGCALSPEELRDVSLFLLLAGHDTSAITLIFTLKFLEQNAHCYQRLLQEHQSIASQRKPSEPFKWVDIMKMKYTWAVLQETLRLRPPIIGGLKEAQRDINYNGYTIPKGWKVFFAMSSTQENEQYFENPHNFDPSRFEVERMQKEGPPSFSFVPFGVGPHACKGSFFARMNMSLYLHYLALGRFRWTSIEPHERYHCFPVPTLSKGYPIQISSNKGPLSGDFASGIQEAQGS